MAGVTCAWVADLVRGPRAWRYAPANASWYARAGNGLTLLCAALAAMPDADLLLQIHRTASHSVLAVGVVFIVAAGVTGWVTPRRAARVAAMCALAYATHPLLDWLAADYSFPHGIQIFWPMSHTWYISPWTLFGQITRRDPLSPASVLTNLRSMLLEVTILTPVLVVLWLVREKTAARLASKLSGGHHPAE